MNAAMSNNIINEISVTRGMKRMTTSELEELCANIQEFLSSQDVKMIESSELEQLKVKIQNILVSHEMKFIKNSGIGKMGIKYQELLNSRGLKKLSDNGISKLRKEVKEVMWKYYPVNNLNLPDYIGEFREEIIIELMKGNTVERITRSVFKDCPVDKEMVDYIAKHEAITTGQHCK